MNSDGNGHTTGGWWGRRRASRNGEQAFAPYHRLALQLHYDLPRGQAMRAALLAAPTRSDLVASGATALAAGLAEELDRQVLLVDAVPRHPGLSRLLECEGRRGWMDLLRHDPPPLEDLLVRTTHERVRFLPAGSASSGSAPPDGIGQLLKELVTRFDFILVAGGAVPDDPMSLAIAPHVGCVLLMAIENESKLEELDAAQDALNACRAQKVGLVLTTPARGDQWKEKPTHHD